MKFDLFSFFFFGGADSQSYRRSGLYSEPIFGRLVLPYKKVYVTIMLFGVGKVRSAFLLRFLMVF